MTRGSDQRTCATCKAFDAPGGAQKSSLPNCKQYRALFEEHKKWLAS